VTTPPLGKLSSPLQSGIPRSFLWIQRPQLVRQFSNAIDVYFTLVTWPEEVEQVVRGTATVVTGPQTPLGMSVTANTIALFSYSRDGENFDDDDWVAVSLRGSRGPLVLTRNSERTPALVAYQLLQFRNAVVTETNFTLVAGVSMPQNRAIVAKRTFLTVSSVMTGSEDLFRCGALRIVDDITTNAFISVARNVASTMCQANAIVSDVPLMGGSESMRISILLSQNSATNCASTFASERAFVTLLGVTPVILSLPFNATQVFPYIDANGCVSVWRSVGDVAVNVVVQVVFIKNSPTASISSTSLTSLTSTSTMLVTSNTGTLVAGGLIDVDAIERFLHRSRLSVVNRCRRLLFIGRIGTIVNLHKRNLRTSVSV
jgi:hypothetical protein